MSYPTTPRALADALQSVVDDLRAMPDTELPEIGLDVGFQVLRFASTPLGRMRAVDLLGWALTGHTGEMYKDGGHYWLPVDVRDRGGLSVSVYTNPEPGVCPHDHSHTREWCGYPDCRES